MGVKVARFIRVVIGVLSIFGPCILGACFRKQLREHLILAVAEDGTYTDP